MLSAAAAAAATAIYTFSAPQHDNLVPTMTAYESVSFYASIVLPAHMSQDARKARIIRVLRMMGLSHAQNTLVRPCWKHAGLGLSDLAAQKSGSTERYMQAVCTPWPHVNSPGASSSVV